LPEISSNTSLFLAYLLGALHVLEPAHGRSVINALLVGSRGSRSDVWKFGFSVIASHLGIAILLALGAWYAGNHLGPQIMAPTFKVIGSALTVCIGILMLTCGIHRHTTCVHKHHGVEDSHDPHHEEVHAQHMLQAHLLSPAVLGFTGGLIPCQGTIALITLAVGNGNLQSAIGLVLAFALGLGSCLIAVGLLTVAGRPKAEAISDKLGNSTALAYAPGALVALMGAVALVYSIAEFSAANH